MMEADFELARVRAEQECEAGIARVRSRVAGGGTDECEDCGEPIEARRRAALPSATRCIACQTAHEREYGANR